MRLDWKYNFIWRLLHHLLARCQPIALQDKPARKTQELVALKEDSKPAASADPGDATTDGQASCETDVVPEGPLPEDPAPLELPAAALPAADATPCDGEEEMEFPTQVRPDEWECQSALALESTEPLPPTSIAKPVTNESTELTVPTGPSGTSADQAMPEPALPFGALPEPAEEQQPLSDKAQVVSIEDWGYGAFFFAGCMEYAIEHFLKTKFKIKNIFKNKSHMKASYKIYGA